MEKIIAFDYMLSLFEKWHNEVAKKGEKFESLSKLSVLKLLFLVSVPKNDTDDEDLLQIFNKFCALPYGPVESEIYTAINSNLLPSYSITERSIKKKADNVKNMSDIGTYALIDKAVEKLKSTNSNLILTNAFDLV